MAALPLSLCLFFSLALSLWQLNQSISCIFSIEIRYLCQSLRQSQRRFYLLLTQAASTARLRALIYVRQRGRDCEREREGRRVRILIEINECFVTDTGNQVGFGTGASEVPKAQLASLKCMVQTVRILNIDWVCLNGSPRLT